MKPFLAPLGISSLLLPLVMALPARAGEDPTQRWALLIGVDDYAELEDLKYAGADVRALQGELLARGFEQDSVFLVEDGSAQSKYRPCGEQASRYTNGHGGCELGCPLEVGKTPGAESSSGQLIPNAFIAAVMGSEKNTGSTRSTMSPETSRKWRLFSSGTSARRAPLSIATCNGSARDRSDLMLP